MTQHMTRDAVELLHGCDVFGPAWARWNGWADGVWRGDGCGCPDDRCVGYHHEPDGDCPCVRSLLVQRAEELQRARIHGVPSAELRAGRFGGRWTA